MKIADLFINLGVKGEGQLTKALKTSGQGLGEVRSMALSTKLAIFAMVYGLKELMANSMQAGSDLSQFASSTGLSAENLQRWQYAARQFNVNAQEMSTSIKSVQDGMTNMLLGKGAPEGLALLSNTVGFDPNKARDTFYVMEQIQKFVQTMPADVGKQLTKSFGISDGVFAAMKRNAFNPDAFARANIYTDRQAESLRRVDVAWENLGDRIQKAIGKMNAKHGFKLISDIEKLTASLLKLSDAFVVIAEKLKLFDVMSNALQVVAGLFLGGADLVDKGNKGKGGFFSNIMDNMEKRKQTPEEMSKAYEKIQQMMNGPATPKSGNQNNQNININQNLNFQHDGKDSKKTSNSVKEAVKTSYRQMPAQGEWA